MSYLQSSNNISWPQSGHLEFGHLSSQKPGFTLTRLLGSLRSGVKPPQTKAASSRRTPRSSSTLWSAPAWRRFGRLRLCRSHARAKLSLWSLDIFNRTTVSVSGCPRSGRLENSPAIHCWEPVRGQLQSVKRTADHKERPVDRFVCKSPTRRCGERVVIH